MLVEVCENTGVKKKLIRVGFEPSAGIFIHIVGRSAMQFLHSSVAV